LFQDEKACKTWVKETKGEREVAERFNDAESLDNIRKCKISFRGFVVDFLSVAIPHHFQLLKYMVLQEIFSGAISDPAFDL
jgi:hypothetical protein